MSYYKTSCFKNTKPEVPLGNHVWSSITTNVWGCYRNRAKDCKWVTNWCWNVTLFLQPYNAACAKSKVKECQLCHTPRGSQLHSKALQSQWCMASSISECHCKDLQIILRGDVGNSYTSRSERGNYLRKSNAVYVLSSRCIWCWSNLH